MAILYQYNTLRELEATFSRQTPLVDISMSDYTRLMDEAKILPDIANIMWMEYASINKTITKEEVMELLGLHPDVNEVVETFFEESSVLKVRSLIACGPRQMRFLVVIDDDYCVEISHTVNNCSSDVLDPDLVKS